MSESTDGRPTRLLSAELSAATTAYLDLAAEAGRAWTAYLKAKAKNQDVRAARDAWRALEYRALVAGRTLIAAQDKTLEEQAREGECGSAPPHGAPTRDAAEVSGAEDSPAR